MTAACNAGGSDRGAVGGPTGAACNANPGPEAEPCYKPCSKRHPLPDAVVARLQAEELRA